MYVGDEPSVMTLVRYLPDWVPGTGFKRIASRWRKDIFDAAEMPFAFVQKQISDGTAGPSYVQALLTKGGKELSEDDITIIKWSAGSLYLGGADTIVALTSCFFLAMVLNPDAQKKAQEERRRLRLNNWLQYGGEREPDTDDEGPAPGAAGSGTASPARK